MNWYMYMYNIQWGNHARNIHTVHACTRTHVHACTYRTTGLTSSCVLRYSASVFCSPSTALLSCSSFPSSSVRAFSSSLSPHSTSSSWEQGRREALLTNTPSSMVQRLLMLAGWSYLNDGCTPFTQLFLLRARQNNMTHTHTVIY